MLTIREFSSSDTEAVVKLWNRCNLITPANDPYADITRKMLINPELFLIGLVDNSLAGSVMGGYEGHRGWINYLAVHPDYRQQGIGKKLVKKVEKLLHEKGCPKINLQIRISNTSVIKFYESLGYQQDDVLSFGKRFHKE